MRPHQSHLFGFAPASISSFRGVEMEVVDREEQRRDALRIRQIEVRAGRDERARALEATLARREQQRRQAAERPVHAPRLARDLPRPLVDDRARVDLGAVLDEQLRPSRAWLCAAAHISAVCSRHSSRALTSAPCCDQRLGRCRVAAARDDHQRRLPVGAAAHRRPRRLSSSASMTAALPTVAASASGVEPNSFAAATSAPAAISRSTSARLSL